MSGPIPVFTWSLASTAPAPAESSFFIGLKADDSRVESVLEPDLRKPVDPADIAPGGKYRSIVKLQIRYEKQAPDDARYAQGTGWLIAPDLLVTAGHCAYDHTYQFGKASQVKAYIGYNGKASLKTADVQFRSGSRIATTKEWVLSDINRAYDVSFIQLDKPFNNVTPIAWSPTPTISTQVIGVVGYPADMTLNDEHGAQMYEMFKEVSFDLRHSTLNMLEYDISSFAGQSGSPVLQRGQNTSIGVHVYGLGNKNSASVIRGTFGNFFKAYQNSFQSSLSDLQDIQGIKVVQIAATEDIIEDQISDSEDFWSTFKTVAGMGAKIGSTILSTGSPFLGPIAGPIAAAAGTAIGIAGKLVNQTESDLEPTPDYKAHASRAILSEAALQTILKMNSQQWKRYGLSQKMFQAYKKNKDAVGPLSKKLAPALMDAAVRISIAHTDPDAATTTSSYPNVPVPTTTEAAIDTSADAFAKGLQIAARNGGHEEGFLDFLGPVIKVGMKVIPAVVGAIAGESSLGPVTNPNHDSIDDHVKILCHRSLMGEAALKALMTIPPKELHEEGFFGDLISTVKNIGSTVIRVAPSVIKTVAPLVLSAVAGESSLESGLSPPFIDSRALKSRRSIADILNGGIPSDLKDLDELAPAIRTNVSVNLARPDPQTIEPDLAWTTEFIPDGHE